MRGGVVAGLEARGACLCGGPVLLERAPAAGDLAAQARDLLLSLRGAALLTGARGRPPVDVDAVADVVARLSELAAAHPEISEIECNPVAAMPDRAIALDARIVLD